MPLFKQCPLCNTRWRHRHHFLSDPDVYLVGYQAHFRQLTTGLILFNHRCRATLGILASEFVDLHYGPVFSARATGTEICPGYCLHQQELRPCPAQCECAFFREVLQRISNWPKDGKAVH